LLVSEKIFTTIRDGSGFFQHGHTYMGHPTACAAALAVQHAIRDEDLLTNVQLMGERLDAALRARIGDNPHVGDIRGRGLFRGVELVADRHSKRPFDSALKINARVKKEAMSRGLMCYPMGGTIDGEHGDHVLLAPPFIIDATQVDAVADLLGQTLEAVLL
jgi:adenosylmethionine-8-amino-7-oxononanoate aminotransferase